MAKLAEMLLRRKELQQKTDDTKAIKQADVFKTRVKRVKVSDDIDEVTADVAQLTLSQVTAEHDFYAKRLRLCDAAIQQANWTTEVEQRLGGCDVMEDYKSILKETTTPA